MIIKTIGIILGLIFIGVVKEFNSLKRLSQDIEFLSQYNNNYVKYCNLYLGKNIKSPQESELFMKLISDAPKAQRLLLSNGLIDYQPAGAGYIIKNYAVLVNTIQSIRNPILLSEEINWINNMLVMQGSLYNELFEDIKRGIRNPLILLREGVQFIVSLPITLLYWTGLIQYSTQYKLTNNIFFKTLSFLIIIIGFISSIFTIALGWEQFKEMVFNYLHL
ncbi:hypothetical protein HHO41_19355 [Bacillus sp. DNRA2]|uniref:hypothetical protein n=1 Tax=Bacillus sp. DNRA2 TaxID=2723053 RepID=UPI00145D1570|nr:hypothetical protein [Bacillus sp. DNRA2]NMD72431.1 hypothetical protein [Bacillus sp. DNRA2]